MNLYSKKCAKAKIYNSLLFCLLFCFTNLTFGQSRETFEDETNGTTTFTDNGQGFEISGTFFNVNSFGGAGWNGVDAADNKFVDNTGETANNDGTTFSIFSDDGTDFVVIDLFVYCANTSLLAHSGTISFTGYKDGNATSVYTFTRTSGFANVVTFSPNNGYTHIDFETDGASDYTDDDIDSLVITSTRDLEYIAFDAFQWDVAVVPVELISFTALVNDNSVELNWETATEISNYGFEIERCETEEVRSEKWEKIGFVIGHGNSNSPKSYKFIDEKIFGGDYSYRLKQIDYDGQYEYSPTVNVFQTISTEFALEQNYPNPFNPTTRIRYSIPIQSRVNIAVYNTLGQQVKLLENRVQNTGTYELNFKGEQLGSGVYIYRMDAESTDGTSSYSKINKMVLLR